MNNGNELWQAFELGLRIGLEFIAVLYLVIHMRT